MRRDHSMKTRRIVFSITMALGVVSFVCLVGYFLALTDIWHELGSPDFWRGEGPSALEWRVLGYGYWPMFVFHLAFLVAATIIMVSWQRRH